MPLPDPPLPTPRLGPRRGGGRWLVAGNGRDLRFIPWGHAAHALQAFVGAWYGLHLDISDEDTMIGGFLDLAAHERLLGVNVFPGSRPEASRGGRFHPLLSDAHGMWKVDLEPGKPEGKVWRRAEPDWEPVALAASPVQVLLRVVVREAAAGAPFVADGIAHDPRCFAELVPLVPLPDDDRPAVYTDGIGLVSVVTETHDLIVVVLGGSSPEVVRELARDRFEIEGWFYDLPTDGDAASGST
jgi:hypothetical protein